MKTTTITILTLLCIFSITHIIFLENKANRQSKEIDQLTKERDDLKFKIYLDSVEKVLPKIIKGQ
jgi:hypothetical protein